jgi:uncharacterized repeat protein (TIGR01451 family)
MKRFLLGMMVLSILGSGVAGAIYAQRFLATDGDSQTAQSEATGDETGPRDLTPTPIPISQPDEQPGRGDPFRVAQTEPANTVSAADQAEVDRLPERTQIDSANTDIPDADPQADTTEPDPAAAGPRLRAPQPRFPERQAAAQAAEDEPFPEPVEPPAEEERPSRRTKTAPRVGREVDRYGRPLTSEPNPRDARSESESAADEPVEEPPARSRRPLAPVTRRPGSAVRDQFDDGPTEADNERASDAIEPQAGGDEGTGRPGDPKLSGSQAPALTIEKTAPPEIQIGKPAKFVIKVRNAGSAVAHDVEIHDTIPQGTQFIEATPPAERQQGLLVWGLGALKPGDEQRVELQLMPTAEGEIGSVATVHFRAEASVRTVATKPMLEVDVNGPDRVMKGQQVTLKIKLTNPGTGAATGVVLTESVPEGLSHAQGSELELDIGTLKPGQTCEKELALMAVAPGIVTNVVTAHGDANLNTEVQTEVEVVAPQLQVGLAGPKRRYLERNATHNISVSNPGTASAKDIELVAVLPKELKFVAANNGGQFDAATRSVYWSLEELPPQETGTVELTTLPVTPGDAKLLIKSTAQQNLSDQREEVLAIEGLAALNFQLSDTSDPVEAGGQTSYEIRVTNQGSKAATGVRLVALVPREMKPLSAEGPVRYQIEGDRVIFEPLKQLAPKADTVYSVKVQALEPGDLRLQVQISTDDIREPITKEESTRVYGDE